MGFERIFEWITQFISLFRFFYVITPMKEGVVCRFGSEKRKIKNDNGVLGTGFHFIWPFMIEDVYVLSMSTRLAEMASQTLVTKDGVNVATGIIITYRVRDISKAIFSVWDAFAAAQDACQANFAQAVLRSTFEEIRADAFSVALTETCRKQGFKYGFEIESVRLAELAPCRTYRLIGNGELAAHDKTA